MKKYFKSYLFAGLLLAFLFAVVGAHAQQQQQSPGKNIVNPDPTTDELSDAVSVPRGSANADSRTIREAGMGQVQFSPSKSFEFTLSIAILIFGMLTLIIITFFAMRSKPKLAYKAILLTLIVTCSVILVVSGYTNEQITGISGILGGISGYLIGKTDSVENEKETVLTTK